MWLRPRGSLEWWVLAFWPCPCGCSLNFSRCQNSGSMCSLHCRSCGSRERRSDLGMMMMTQKRLLVSGIRWQEGKRRKGKPSSLVFEQTYLFYSLWLSYQKQSTKPSPVDFFFRNYIWNSAVSEEETYFSSSLAKDWAGPILLLWYQFTFQGHHQRPSPLDLEASVVWPCSFTTKCSVSAAFALLQPVPLSNLPECIWSQIWQKKEKKKLKRSDWVFTAQLWCPCLGEGMCYIENSKYILLNFKATCFFLSCHWHALFTLCISSARRFFFSGQS